MVKRPKTFALKKSPLAPLFQRGVLVPPFGKGRIGGIFPAGYGFNSETLNSLFRQKESALVWFSL